jgi:membrane protein YqaA with SNARE-associated domain
VALIAAAGQSCAQVVLYFFGDQIRKRWGWFDRQCERARVRFGKSLGRNIFWLGITSGLIGLPPTSATAALAPGLGLDFRRLLPLMFIGRVARFAVVTLVASRI